MNYRPNCSFYPKVGSSDSSIYPVSLFLFFNAKFSILGIYFNKNDNNCDFATLSNFTFGNLWRCRWGNCQNFHSFVELSFENSHPIVHMMHP